jgi:hypothetical protein
VNIYYNCLQGLRPRLHKKVLNSIPSTWLDPLLSGPGGIKIPAGCPDIERLLNNIRVRVSRFRGDGVCAFGLRASA